MKNKFDVLRELGYSDEFIRQIEDDSEEKNSVVIIPNNIAITDNISVYQNDFTEMIIDKSIKPQSFIISSI